MQDLLITSLGPAGVKQTEIRKIVGCSMDRVSRIVKHLERGTKNDKDRK
jgi:predicted transcriptional regulator